MQFKTLSYPTLAFEFQYPVTTATGRKLPVIISRKPERYSSAAPMTADARQRIVTELVDFPDGITISVSVSRIPVILLQRSMLSPTVELFLCAVQRRLLSRSVQVGPPPPWLNERKPDEWKPRDVANAVLIDRSDASATFGSHAASVSIPGANNVVTVT